MCSPPAEPELDGSVGATTGRGSVARFEEGRQLEACDVHTYELKRHVAHYLGDSESGSDILEMDD